MLEGTRVTARERPLEGVGGGGGGGIKASLPTTLPPAFRDCAALQLLISIPSRLSASRTKSPRSRSRARNNEDIESATKYGRKKKRLHQPRRAAQTGPGVLYTMTRRCCCCRRRRSRRRETKGFNITPRAQSYSGCAKLFERYKILPFIHYFLLSLCLAPTPYFIPEV